jgi:hypothetical protein
MNRKLGAGVVSASILLAGCSGMGAQPVLTRAGVVDDDVRTGIIGSGEIYSFVQAERRARPYEGGLTTETQTRGSRGRVEDPTATREMLETGFAAITASCDDFFQSSGRDQTRLLVLRDIIVAATMATGALAIADRNGEMGGTGNENALSWLTLGSSAALTGIDIYTQRYLFGAENIDAVRDLTMQALEVHRTAVLNPAPGTAVPATYERALGRLRENQAKCSPRAIARLARDAIAAGRVEADSREGSVQAARDLAADQQVLARLGEILDIGGPLSDAEAGALWWFLQTSDELKPSANEIKTVIAPLIRRIKEARSPLAANGTPKATWDIAQSVRDALADLSASTLIGFRRQVLVARGVAAEQALTADVVDRATVPDAREAPRFRMGAAATSGDGAIRVRVVQPN